MFREKYGVENISQLESIKNKKIETCLYKYDVEHHLQNIDILEKQKATNMLLYGYEFQMQNPDNKQGDTPVKAIDTCLEKYGVEFVFQNKEIKEKSNKTKFEKYGDENYNNRVKMIQTMIEKGICLSDEQRSDFKNYWLKVKVITTKNKKKLFETGMVMIIMMEYILKIISYCHLVVKNIQQ